ncbi:hypothetical protein [Haloarcula litorea]|uniref:hypothetical protein n=1 Tax=Haloarcula litorea TaxID=3032579 RepID=UPI0023E854EF|nr:hypothetical protein [Halomicroarcula sp. GDY20]
MPPTRRSLLRAAGLSAAAVAGCATGDGPATDTEGSTPTETDRPTPSATGTFADRPSGPKMYPEPPAEVTADAAVAFAEEFEAARVHNSLHEPDVTDLSARGTAAHDTAAHRGHYVVATGGGYANYEDGVHADWGQLPALYFVGPGLVVRTAELADRVRDCEDVYAAPERAGNFAPACEGDDASYRAYCLHPEPRELTVTVEWPGEDGATTVLERTHTVGYDRGVEQLGVTRRSGTHRVTASLADGPTATHEWDLATGPPEYGPPLTVLVTPTGGLRFHRPAFPEVR